MVIIHTLLQIQGLYIISMTLGYWWNILEIDGKEKAAIERYFGEVDLNFIENMLNEKFPCEKDAADFKKVFTQLFKIISTFMKNVVTTEFVKRLIKSRFGLTSEEYNIKLLHSLSIIWQYYILLNKVTEAVVHRCSSEFVFLKISQIS